MRFRLADGCHCIKGMPRGKLLDLLDSLGWSGEYESDTRSVRIWKSGSVEYIPLDDFLRVKVNMLISRDSFLVSKTSVDLSSIDGYVCPIEIQSVRHDCIKLEDGTDLYGWSSFYTFEPFTGIVKVKCIKVEVIRKFISGETIACGPDTIPLEIWKMYTHGRVKDTCRLSRNLKLNCLYVDTPGNVLSRLESSMGEICNVQENIYEIVDTGEMTTLSPGDIVVYNQHILLHIESVQQFSGFEMI